MHVCPDVASRMAVAASLPMNQRRTPASHCIRDQPPHVGVSLGMAPVARHTAATVQQSSAGRRAGEAHLLRCRPVQNRNGFHPFADDTHPQTPFGPPLDGRIIAGEPDGSTYGHLVALLILIGTAVRLGFGWALGLGVDES